MCCIVLKTLYLCTRKREDACQEPDPKPHLPLKSIAMKLKN
jgi:hypothetical protein